MNPYFFKKFVAFIAFFGVVECFWISDIQGQQAASNDLVLVENNEPITIEVLANDGIYCNSGNVSIGITNQPVFGTVNLLENNTVEYIPNPNANFEEGLVDMLSYCINETDGTTLAVAYVFLMGGVDIIEDAGVGGEDNDETLIEEIDMCEVLTCVWPGDANHDGLVNAWDMLSVGVGYEMQGPPRMGSSTEWEAQLALDWGFQQTDGSNYKHIDGDGNGIINMADVTSIRQNYTAGTSGKTEEELNNESEIELSLHILNESISENDTIQIQVQLGGSDEIVQDVYGVAFSIRYNEGAIQSNSFQFDYEESWLGETDELLWIAKQLNGTVESSVVRMNHFGVTGNGIVCGANFIMEDVLAGKTEDYNLELDFEKVTVIKNDGSEIIVKATGDSQEVIYSGVSQILENKNYLSVFPNPAIYTLNIELDKIDAQKFELVDTKGQIVLKAPIKINNGIFNMSINDLHTGIYMLRVFTATGILQERIAIVR